MAYLVPALALSDLHLQQADLVLGLLKLLHTLACSAIELTEATLLLFNQPLEYRGRHVCAGQLNKIINTFSAHENMTE